VYLSRNLVIVRIRRDFPALAAMDAAGRPSDGHRDAAGVRHVALWLSGITPPVFHPLALVLIAITAALLWRRAAASPS